MKKCLLIISFVLISLLAVSAVSAGDSNVTDDSPVQLASQIDNEQVEMEQADDLKDESPLNAVENQPEILTDGEKQTPNVEVDNVTIMDYEPTVVPFNVTDSSGNLISGEVVVKLSDEYDEMYSYVNVNNGSDIDTLKKLDLNSIEKYDNGLSLLDVYNIVYSSMNSTKFNSTLIAGGLTDIYNGIDLNISSLILTIADSGLVDLSKVGPALKEFIGDINATNFYILYNLSDAVKVDVPAFVDALGYTLKGFNLTVDDIVKVIKDTVSYLNLKIPLNIYGEILSIISSSKPVDLHDVFKIVKELYGYNNLGMSDIADALDNAAHLFDVSKVIQFIIDSKDNAPVIYEGLSKLYKSLNINYTKAMAIVKDMVGKYDLNMTKVVKLISDITGMDASSVGSLLDGIGDIYKGITFNETYAEGWMKDILNGDTTNIISKILNISQLNTSSLKSGFDKIFSQLNIKLSTFLTACDLIGNFGKVNSTMILGGLDKILIGLGGDAGDVATKMISKIGYYAEFPYGAIKPGIHNITVKYMENEKFNSAVNDTAKLTIVPSQDVLIHVYGGDLPEKYGDDSKFYVFLLDGYDNEISGVLDVYLNDKKIDTVATDDHGYLPYTIKNLASGYYDLKFEYANVSESIGFAIVIPKVSTKIVYSNMKTVTVNTKVDGKIGKYFKVTLKDKNGKALANKAILIGYNGKTYKKTTDKNGAFKLQINLAKAGAYTVAVCFLGDNVYGASYITAKITVKKQTAKLAAKKKTFKVKAKRKILKATFKSAKGHAIKGKVIKFTVKGKTYSAKTNKKGVASVNLKLAKKGTYKVAVKFAGDAMYNKLTKKIKIKIK